VGPILEFNSSVINSLLLGFIILFLLIKSKSWTGPAIENRIGKIENTLKILSGNFGRLEHDFDLFKQEIAKTDEEMLSEMKSIGTVGHEFNLLKTRFTQIEEDFLKIDQMTTALPCNPCGGERK
jgi:hypothetical protein